MTTMLVPHTGSSAAEVRHALVRELHEHGVPQHVVDDALLVMSELVGNAIRHGEPMAGEAVRASWWVAGGAVHLEVCDGGPGLPGEVGEVRLGARHRRSGPDGSGDAGTGPDTGSLPVPLADEGGRGLPIVDLLSARWGTTAPGPSGVVAVYAELPLDSTATVPQLSRGGRTVDAPPVGPWAAGPSAGRTAVV